jgi:hypothetical protein
MNHRLRSTEPPPFDRTAMDSAEWLSGWLITLRFASS